MVIAIFTFVFIAGMVSGIYWLLVLLPERRTRQQLRRRLEAFRERTADAPRVVREQRLSGLQLLQGLLTRLSGLTQPLHTLLDRAGVNVTVGTFLLASAFGALLVFMLAGVLIPSLSTRAGLGALSALMPLTYVRWAQAVRRRRFEELFPEALEIIARSLRAGHAFTTGLAIAAEQVPDPVGTELKKLYDWQNYGRPFEESIRNFAQRAPIVDARFFATAVLTQRETGGNLSEVLDNLTAVIRDRFKVKRQVRVLTAQGRLSGWVLAAAPPALALLLFLINPDHMLGMLHDPLGVRLLIAALVLQAIGTVLIRKIVNVEY